MINEPQLMPFQDRPFNGDTFIEQEFLAIRDRFNITTAIETGTCLGYTTLWLAKNFEKVYTIELNKQYVDIARAKFLQYPNITSIHGNSEDIVKHLRIDGNALFFLDAHGFGAKRCPLLSELYGIHKLCIKNPIITIHDFKTDNDELGYDSYNGQPYTFDWIKSMIEKIYGVDNYTYYFNKEVCENSAKRGIIYITPNIVV